VRTWIPVLALALGAAACDDGVECCVDGGSNAVIRGAVVDQDGSPLAGVTLEPIDARRECRDDGFVAPGPRAPTILSDGEGRFEMTLTLFLTSPGTYCVDLSLRLGERADTARAIEVEAAWETAPADTTVVTLVPGW
jgi:hypothetical protein